MNLLVKVKAACWVSAWLRGVAPVDHCTHTAQSTAQHGMAVGTASRGREASMGDRTKV